MKLKQFSLFIVLLLILTSCGTNIYLDGVRIEFPERSTATEQPSATVTLGPPSSTPTSTPSVTPTASPTITSGIFAYTTANVNLRTVPTTAQGNTTIIRVLLTGTQVHLVARNAAGDWVYSDAPAGWVYYQNLRYTGVLNNLPLYPLTDPTPTREYSRIGYNTNGEAVPDMAYYLRVVSEPCSTVSLVMNNLALAVQIKEICPDAIVISRNYNPQEGDEWVLSSPQSRIDMWNREGHKEIVRHSTNEPSFGRGRRLEEFVAKECELMRLARANGITMAMGNFSVGIFEPADVNAGLFDPYLRCLELYGHYLALHEYAVAVLPMGVGQWQTSFLLDRNRVQPASWPLPAALPTCWSGELAPYWYLMRGTWFICRADAIGVARPRIVLTEFGWDNLPNIKSEIEPLRLQYGLPQYMNDMRGINTYSRLWAWYWPQWTFARAACEQLIWADRVYPPEYIGFALFTWGWYEKSYWRQTDFSGRENPELISLHVCLADR